MKTTLIHPTGNANVRNAVQGLLNADLLYSFYTTIALFPETIGYRAAGIGPLKPFRKRTYAEDLRSYVHRFPFWEFGRVIAERLGLTNLIRHESGPFCVDRIYRTLDKHVARQLGKEEVVYAYEDGALETFRKAKALNKTCLYDLPIGYWRAMRELLEPEQSARPAWSMTLTGFKDSDEKLERKDEELALADHIFVASSFTKETLAGYPGALSDIHVVPYGFPQVGNPKNYVPLEGRKLKLLFVGGLSQRKGIANLFEAVEELHKHVELTVVGRTATVGCVPLEQGLRKHHWIPSLPHQEVLALMREHDVLVFPSLFEGFGLVITEAMSQGTPVITTERTAGPDLISHGNNGWLIEAGSTEALKKQIASLLLQPEKIKANGLAAMETARKRPWSEYGKELAEKVKEIITG